mgnify:CR=1 FL=1
MMPLLKRLLDRLLAPWMRPADQQPASWRLQAEYAAAEERALSGRKLLYGVAATVSALILWSAFAEIDEVTRGQGKVIPSRQVQIIQSQDGGLVSEILVAEGDVVREGQLLVRLDSTRSTSSFRERLREFQALSVKEVRLRALIEEAPFVPSTDLRDSVPRIVAQEQSLYDSSKAELGLKQQIASQQLRQRREELNEMNAKAEQLRRGLELAQHS